MHALLGAASETRPVFWHFVTWLKVLWYVLAVASVVVFAYGVAGRSPNTVTGRANGWPPVRELGPRLVAGVRAAVRASDDRPARPHRRLGPSRDLLRVSHAVRGAP